MNNITVKTNFTAGQVSANLFGRGDLAVFDNGAKKLENVIIHPTGGVSRRYGLRYVDENDKKTRLIPFEFNTEQTYLICLYDKGLKVYKDEECVAELSAPWAEGQIFNISWTQSADTLLIVHPDVEPQQISRKANEVWTIEAWQYHKEKEMIMCPYFNFYQKKVKIWSISTYKTMHSDTNIFTPQWVGVYIKFNKGLMLITGYTDSKNVTSTSIKSPTGYGEATDWEEAAFSSLRGWPSSVTFHQDRMVIGGSKSLPNRIWLSKSSDLFNFDLGEGLDDEAIEFAILSDQVNAIKAVVSSRHLLVFTTGAEWMVTGEPLTPTSIQLSRQTSVGIYTKRLVPPQQVDGATIFVSKNGEQLREFLFADIEQAYMSKDLTLLSNKIISNPQDAAFDADVNILYFVLEDGTISALTSYRTENVNAWSKMLTSGKFISIAVVGDKTYFSVYREGKYSIEVLEKAYYVDSGIKLISQTSKKIWTVPERFNEKEVCIVADGFNAGIKTVVSSQIELSDEASELIIGYAYSHCIEPLPYVQTNGMTYSPLAYRLVNAIFRLLETNSFDVDIGRGYISVPLKRMSENKILDSTPVCYTGDVKLSALGWIRDLNQPMWSIKSYNPSSFTLLSVTSEVKSQD